MAIRALKRRTDRADFQEVENTDDAIFPSIVNEGSGTAGNLYGTGDTATQTVNVGTGSAVTTITVGTSSANTTITGGAIALNATAASNFTVSGATADLTLGARAATITLNESGDETLNSLYATASVSSIIGAFNAIARGEIVVGGGGTLQSAYEGGNTITTSSAEGSILIDGTENFDVDLEVVSLDANSASNFTVSGATADLTLGARAATITLNESGDETLNSLYATASVDSIVGALNAIARGEIISSGGNTTRLVNTYIAGENLSAGEAVYISDTDTVSLTDADAETTSNFIGIALNDIASSSSGLIVTFGAVNALLISGLTIGTGDGEVGAGNPVFLSLTAGSLTTDVSAFTSGDTAYAIGYIKDVLTYNSSSDLVVEIQMRDGARTLLT